MIYHHAKIQRFYSWSILQARSEAIKDFKISFFTGSQIVHQII